jgi:hypothetical protein
MLFRTSRVVRASPQDSANFLRLRRRDYIVIKYTQDLVFSSVDIYILSFETNFIFSYIANSYPPPFFANLKYRSRWLQQVRIH